MFDRIRNRTRSYLFDFGTKGILRTPPLETSGHSDLTIVTMLRHEDVTMYLIAIKSLYSRIQHGAVIVVDDGTLTGFDQERIAAHLRGVSIISISTIDSGECPRGNLWERLLFILDLSRSGYVIQMDADTLAVGALNEVLECCHANTPFALGTGAGRSIVGLPVAAAFLHDNRSDHINVVGERQFAHYPDGDKFRYVRGSAGFAGFSRGGFSRARLEEFSGRMADLLGTRWTEWGTEQIASNFAVANSRGAVVLPYPKYACFHPGLDTVHSAFIHFIGTHRFDGGVYQKLSLAIIDSLLAQPSKG